MQPRSGHARPKKFTNAASREGDTHKFVVICRVYSGYCEFDMRPAGCRMPPVAVRSLPRAVVGPQGEGYVSNVSIRGEERGDMQGATTQLQQNTTLS